MKKKNIVKVLLFVLIIVLAVVFMFIGAKEESRKYSIEEVKNYNYYVLQKDGKYGVIDKNANVIIEPKYETVVIPNPSKEIFVCTNENKETKILNSKNEEQFTEYKEVSSIRLKNIVSDLMYEKSVLKYQKDGKYGLIDYKGSKITDAVYGHVDALEYKEGELLVEQNGKYGVINIKGVQLVPIEYETIKVDEFFNGKDYSNAGYIVGTKTEEGYRYGYIDVDGNEVLKPEYNELSRVAEIKEDKGMYFLAAKNGQYGVYKNSEQIINNEYQSISFNNNLFLLEKSKKYGVADIDGNIILDVKYSQIDINGKYLYAKDRSGKTEVYDNTGKASNMSENVSKLSVADGKYSIVIKSENNQTLYGIEDETEKELVKPEYNYIEYLFGDFFIVSNSEGKLGVIDKNGNSKIETKYSSIQKIKETKLIQTSISSENITEIYSEKMEKIAQLSEAVITEVNGYVRVYNNKENIYISEDGKKVTSKEVYKNNELFAVVKEGKWGFEDSNNNIKLECKYDKVTEFNEFGFAGIMQDGKWGVIDKNLKIVLEPKYEFKTKEDPYFLGAYYRVTYALGEVIYTNM